MVRITATTLAVILIMLLFVYRSIITVILLLLTVGFELVIARGAVAVVGHTGLIGLSTFAVSLLTSLAIAAGTDYGIFIIGRYQEARHAGEDTETAFYTMYRGTAHVILGSGLTIAGAHILPQLRPNALFQNPGRTVRGRHADCGGGRAHAGAGGPDRRQPIRPVRPQAEMLSVRGWRRVGTAVVRWPVPVLAARLAVALVGLLTLPGYKASYNDRGVSPQVIPANQGFAAADRHFSQARMKPEIL